MRCGSSNGACVLWLPATALNMLAQIDLMMLQTVVTCHMAPTFERRPLHPVLHHLMMHETSGWKEAVMSGVGTDLDDRRLYSCRL